MIDVLYIDDDEQLLELTSRYLERDDAAFAVETTDSPREGLAMLQRREFHAVVCDYQMPDMDGLDVLDTIRTEHDDDVPFIIFTGEGREDVAIEALNLGADRYLQKGGTPAAQYGVLAQAITQETRHHRTKTHLRNREENLRVTLESIGDAVITTDVEGRITRLNPVAESLTGWDREDAMGAPLPEVFEIISQDDRTSEPDPARRVLEEGTTVGLANGTILVREDGTERYIADSASPIETAAGETIGVVIVFRDVTDAYRTRERRRQQREALIDLSTAAELSGGDVQAATRTITETAAETLDVDRASVWLFEPDGTALQCVDLFDRAANAHSAGATLRADEYPDYFEALETHRSIPATDARSDPRTAGLAESYLDPHGITSLLDATVRADGDVVGMVCHEQVDERRDWTDDEQAFAAAIADQLQRLLANERRVGREVALRSLHDIATEITSLSSAEAICERTIRAAETILEFDMCVINLEEDGMLPIVATSSELPPEGATPMSVEEGIVGKTYRTGESFLFEDATTAEEANPQGEYRAAISVPIGEFGVFQTVHETAGAYDEDDLDLVELLVAHAATALARLDNERALRRQNERLDEFTGVASHDLRNPLNVAQGRLDLLADECDDEGLDVAMAALDRMEAIIEDLLALAREGESVSSFELVSLPAIAERSWSTVDTGAATLDVTTDRLVRADPGRFQRLLENLVRNAVEHGGPDVTVTIGSLGDGTGIFLADDGRGMSPADRDALLDGSGVVVGEESGLGLGIVSRIAGAHDWDLTLTESETGGLRVELSGVTFQS